MDRGCGKRLFRCKCGIAPSVSEGIRDIKKGVLYDTFRNNYKCTGDDGILPLKNYGVLKGKPVDSMMGRGQNPHY
jgi:hypothetical protein